MPNGQVYCEAEGDWVEISKMICRAMIGNMDIMAAVMGAIPSCLDEKKLSRSGYCKTVMDAVGSKIK